LERVRFRYRRRGGESLEYAEGRKKARSQFEVVFADDRKGKKPLIPFRARKRKKNRRGPSPLTEDREEIFSASSMAPQTVSGGRLLIR